MKLLQVWLKFNGSKKDFRISEKRPGPFNWTKFEFPSSNNALCQVWSKLAQWFGEEDVLISSIYFRYLLLHPLGKRRGPSFAFCPMMLSAQFGLNWPNGSGEEDFRPCIFAISLLSPLCKGRALHVNKLESPSTKDVLCQVWSKLDQ